MPTLRWDRLRWEEFRSALRAYQNWAASGSQDDDAYLRCVVSLEGLSSASKAAHAEEIVDFLNRWRCRVSRADASSLLSAWILDNETELEGLSDVKVLDATLPETSDALRELYERLDAAGRGSVHNWGDATTSKALHQLLPGLCVMWDGSIKHFATDYGEFMIEMNALGRRLVSESPYAVEEVEREMQDQVGSKRPKTFAKYLDEYNWWTLVGESKSQ